MQRFEYTSSYCLQADATSANVTTSTYNLDFKIQNHSGESFAYKYIWGGKIYVDNANLGDYVAIQIVDVDNILGYGLGTVLKQYIRKHFVFDKTLDSFRTNCPGKCPIGLYVRLIYNKTGANNPTVFVNYEIHTKDD